MIEPTSVLSGFLAEEARTSVVQLRDPNFDSGVFSGFFISPAGHLITAFHAVKAHLFTAPTTFPLDVRYSDGTSHEAMEIRCEAGWFDLAADWALLKLDLVPPGYLPIGPPEALTRPDIDCAPMRVYGFTVVDEGRMSLGGLSGEYLRPVPERRRFRLAFSVRSQGQSGGPVIDLRSSSVVGSVVGFREDERLTADAAIIDRATVQSKLPGTDLGDLATRWRRRAVAHLTAANPELARLTAASAPPPRPERYLADRAPVHRLRQQLVDHEESALFFHGAPGSGKSMLAAELVDDLRRARRVDSAHWYDFEPAPARAIDRLVRSLALHLLGQQGVLEPIEEVIDGSFLRDTGPAQRAVVEAVRLGCHVLVFDNVHFPQRDGQQDITDFLAGLIWAARGGDSIVLFTSWDRPLPQLPATVSLTYGLARNEISEYLGLHGLTVSPDTVNWIADMSEDITCVEQFVRSPDWQLAVNRGDQDMMEPDELHQHWLNRYLAHVPLAARQVLLALAVVEAPTTRSIVERSSGTAGFASTLETLRHSPPLVHRANDRLYLHSNVARAVLATTDGQEIDTVRRRAAGCLQEDGQHLSAARLHLQSGEIATAVTLLFEHRDEIIARGGGTGMRKLTDQMLAQPELNLDWLAQLHAVIASCENIRGDYQKAARHWELALAGQPNTLEAATMRNRRADSLRMASRYQEAATDYADAARLAETSKRRMADAAASVRARAARELGRAHLGLAKLDRLHADYQQSEQRYQQARQAFSDVFDVSGGIEADFGLGEVRRLVGDWPGALAAYQESLVNARSRSNLEREAYALWGIGEVLRLTGDVAGAERHHLEGLNLCVEVGDTRSEGWALLGLAETYRISERVDEAVETYLVAIARFEATMSTTELGHARIGLADAKRQLGEIDLSLYQAARDVYEAKHLRHSTIQCYQGTALALRELGQPGPATKLLSRAQRLASRHKLDVELDRIRHLVADPTSIPPIAFNYP